MICLTRRQEEVLHFVAEETLRSGIQPSYREIGERFGAISMNGVSDHLRALGRKGFLGSTGRSRGMEITDAGWQYAEGLSLFGFAE